MTDESDHTAVPSAPPNPCSTRVWSETGEKTDTTLLHTASKRPSKKRSSTVSSPSRGCSTTSSHTPSKRPPRPSTRSHNAGRRQSSGLIVRGSTYYLRLRVPRPLAGIIGKTHVMKSLGTGYRADAVSPTSVKRRAIAQTAPLPPPWGRFRKSASCGRIDRSSARQAPQEPHPGEGGL
ncbi:DUF6538 domain-containing protein [Brevundimonas vesicularis]|uniref:DUF6538 domain-containing protein n=1 Tax=Brevundimonas vesicularis TaxID=41276 RepID=UPI0034D25FAF